jgi:lysophospholipase L1-like esterase
VLVEDESVPGTKLQDDLSPNTTSANPLATHLASSDADIVATNSEINDYFSSESSGDYAVLLQQWVQTVRAANKTPLLIEPNPVCRAAASAYTQQDFVAQMRAQGAALGVPVIPMFDAFSQLNPQPIGPDCIHPTSVGYVFKESQLIAALAPLIQQMLAQRGML